jgi:hypothetical protein
MTGDVEEGDPVPDALIHVTVAGDPGHAAVQVHSPATKHFVVDVRRTKLFS